MQMVINFLNNSEFDNVYDFVLQMEDFKRTAFITDRLDENLDKSSIYVKNASHAEVLIIINELKVLSNEFDFRVKHLTIEG